MNRKTKEIINLLASNEDRVKKLYLNFAKCFSSQSAFWTGIATEESRHHDLLLTLLKEDFDIPEDRFDTASIRCVSDYLDQLIDDAQLNAITNDQAIKISSDLEENLEVDILGAKENDPVQLKKILDQLKEETSSHSSRISKLAKA